MNASSSLFYYSKFLYIYQWLQEYIFFAEVKPAALLSRYLVHFHVNFFDLLHLMIRRRHVLCRWSLNLWEERNYLEPRTKIWERLGSLLWKICHPKRKINVICNNQLQCNCLQQLPTLRLKIGSQEIREFGLPSPFAKTSILQLFCWKSTKSNINLLLFNVKIIF